MRIEMFGPNLRDQSKGQFHVHAAGCADCRHYGSGRKFGGETWPTMDVESRWECALDVYSDHMDEDPDYADNQGYWLADFWFAPCVSKLPFDTKTPEEENMSVEAPEATKTVKQAPFTSLPKTKMLAYLQSHPTVPDKAWTTEVRAKGEKRDAFLKRQLGRKGR